MSNSKTLTISAGGSRSETNWKQVVITISDFYERLKQPQRGKETIAEYLSMKKAQQDNLKDVGGFMAGTLSGPRRKATAVTGRCVVTLDFDNIPAGKTDAVLAKVEGLGINYCVYSTRKHRTEAPRLRVLFPSDRIMSPDEYEPVSRKLAQYVGIEMADPTTFETSRLMYFPSCCADGEYVFRADAEKPCFDVDSILKQYTDWHSCAEWPQVPGNSIESRAGKQQADPESKPGIVGAYCRTYDVYRAMDELLPGVYDPVDNTPNRYTYLGGSTTGGAVIYDDGKFLFSHHATDPCSGREVNAFDLVRLHKFGDMDDQAGANTPANKMPSFKAMLAFANGLPSVMATMNTERYQSAANDFEGVESTNDNAPANWMLHLQRALTGGFVASIENYAVVLEYDPRLKNRIINDSFADKTFGIAPLPWGNHASETEGSRFSWNDADDAGLRKYLENLLGFDNKNKLEAALCDHLAKHEVNPVRDYLKALAGKWDGMPRLDTLFIDYLGAEDNLYNRAVTRKAFTAAAARAMAPGCKYDNMLILCGPQGIGKSTILDKMSLGFFNDSIRTFEGKEASELLQGVWIVEIAELDAFRRSDAQRIKQFLSIRADRYRKAYGHRAGEHPRSCVFFGTTNTFEYLQDTTGNRRFWPVDVGITASSKSVWDDLDKERDQIWAEAYVRWQTGEALYLTGEVETFSRNKQEEHRDVSPLEGSIQEFLDLPIPADWNNWGLDTRLDYWARNAKGDYELVQRDVVCAMEILREMLRVPIASLTEKRQKQEVTAILNKLGWLPIGPRRMGMYGSQRCHKRPFCVNITPKNP